MIVFGYGFYLFLVVGENVNEFFFRVASLAFEINVLAELEKSGSRQIGDVVSEYPNQPLCNDHISSPQYHAWNTTVNLFQRLTAPPAVCTRRQRRSSQTVVSEDGGKIFEGTDWTFVFLSGRWPAVLNTWEGLCGRNRTFTFWHDWIQFFLALTEFSSMRFLWCCSV